MTTEIEHFAALPWHKIRQINPREDADFLSLLPMHRYASETIKNHKWAYLRYVLTKCYYWATHSYNLGGVFFILLLDSIALIHSFRSDFASDTWLCQMVLRLAVYGGVFTAFAGAQADYGRLVTPVFPLVLLLSFVILDHLPLCRLLRSWLYDIG
jgi:hypothetical protein